MLLTLILHLILVPLTSPQPKPLLSLVSLPTYPSLSCETLSFPWGFSYLHTTYYRGKEMASAEICLVVVVEGTEVWGCWEEVFDLPVMDNSVTSTLHSTSDGPGGKVSSLFALWIRTQRCQALVESLTWAEFDMWAQDHNLQPPNYAPSS